MAVFPLSDVGVLCLASPPDHLAVGAVRSRVSHTVAEQARVLALIVRPDVGALAISNIILEISTEGPLIVIIHDATLSIQSSVFIPAALVSAGSDLDHPLADKFALAWLVVCRG